MAENSNVQTYALVRKGTWRVMYPWIGPFDGATKEIAEEDAVYSLLGKRHIFIYPRVALAACRLELVPMTEAHMHQYRKEDLYDL